MRSLFGDPIPGPGASVEDNADNVVVVVVVEETVILMDGDTVLLSSIRPDLAQLVEMDRKFTDRSMASALVNELHGPSQWFDTIYAMCGVVCLGYIRVATGRAFKDKIGSTAGHRMSDTDWVIVWVVNAGHIKRVGRILIRCILECARKANLGVSLSMCLSDSDPVWAAPSRLNAYYACGFKMTHWEFMRTKTVIYMRKEAIEHESASEEPPVTVFDHLVLPGVIARPVQAHGDREPRQQVGSPFN
jgi:hypothetical protein